MTITDLVLDLPDDPTPWRLFVPENAKQSWAVLWLQGFTSTIEGHSDGCKRMTETQGVAHAILDYAGHGTHPTPLDDAVRSQQLAEVIGVYDELQKMGYEHIIVSGGSFGGYMAALLTESRSPEAVILRAPANYPDDEFDMPYVEALQDDHHVDNSLHTWREALPEGYANRPLAAISGYEGSVYVFEHELDETIPSHTVQMYFAAAKHGTYILVRGCPHSVKNATNPAHFITIIERWCAAITANTIQEDS